MRAVSLPRFPPAQSAGASRALWYALLMAVLLLAAVALLAIVGLQGGSAEPQLLAPFRWFSATALA